jgi:predicted lipid-binding transport protein (Tim44 family)
VDAVNDERGQALVIAVFALGIVATVIGGLRMAQDRILALHNERRAGEAAVEAATAVIADAYLAELRRAASATASPPPAPDILGAVTASVTRESARVAASGVSLANGAREIDDVTVRCDRALVEVTLHVSGTSYRAGFPVAGCSQR